MDKLNKNKINNDPLLPEVAKHLKKYDFGVASLIQKKFKIGFSRAERILKEIRRRELL